MKVVTVVGNRPQFVKAAAVSPHLRARATEVLVHSGQHYNPLLSEIFFEQLGLPYPDRQLDIGSGTHAEQTATAMERLEPLLLEERPDAVIVYGDTNTTLAAALVTAQLQLPLVHVEAGMRSFDRTMPEEVNRIVVDRLAGLLLCATETAVANLMGEGQEARARLVGDTMIDVALELGPLAERESDIRDRLGVRSGHYLVATLHRAGNVDRPASLKQAVALLIGVAEQHGPLVFAVHPRTRAALARERLLERLEAAPELLISQPLGYLDFLCLLRGARTVLTDSGGVQKEAYLAEIPCLTMREQTEWVETLEDGWNRLIGLDTRAALAALAVRDVSAEAGGPRLYGGGGAGEHCAEEIVTWLRTGNQA